MLLIITVVWPEYCLYNRNSQLIFTLNQHGLPGGRYLRQCQQYQRSSKFAIYAGTLSVSTTEMSCCIALWHNLWIWCIAFFEPGFFFLLFPFLACCYVVPVPVWPRHGALLAVATIHISSARVQTSSRRKFFHCVISIISFKKLGLKTEQRKTKIC